MFDFHRCGAIRRTVVESCWVNSTRGIKDFQEISGERVSQGPVNTAIPAAVFAPSMDRSQYAGTICRLRSQIDLPNQVLTGSGYRAGGFAPLAVRSYWLRFPSFVSITRGFPMKAWIPLTLVFAFGLAAHAQATCIYPQPPAAPPNGAQARRD